MLSPTKKKTKMFHASMKVTRLEEWCVEAETCDQARALLEAAQVTPCASANASTWSWNSCLRIEGCRATIG
jgi:hypothetical protein